MSVRVLKFGGTSVGKAEALTQALGVVRRAQETHAIVVVASALCGVTDMLVLATRGSAIGSHDSAHFVTRLRARHIDLLHAVASGRPAAQAVAHIDERLAQLRGLLEGVSARGACSPSEQDAIAALGERLSVPIVTAGLLTLGVPAEAVDAGDLIRTDATFGAATVDFPGTRECARRRLGDLAPGVVPVVTGFLGATASGQTTTLGRGGSDYSAAVLGAVLSADRVEIWTDVDGVMSADPQKVETAVTLPRLSYAEATRLAQQGARVLHPETTAPLRESEIPLLVRNTLRPEQRGTWIGPDLRDRPRRVDVVLAGARGQVARSFLARLHDLSPDLADIRVRGAFSRDRAAWSRAGLAPLAVGAALDAGAATPWRDSLRRLLSKRRRAVVLVDCTASAELAGEYARLLEHGIGIVTPNKRGVCLPVAEHRRLRTLARQAGVPWSYATTVGAGLPVLRSIRELTRTGDRLRGVQAVLSGTLSFVLHRVQEGVPFSEAVAEAQARGLTEPDPRQDLSGLDVARKLLILLREARLPFELEDVEVTALVPEGGAALATLDAPLRGRVGRALAAGRRLVVVARYDGDRPRVGLEEVAAESPLARVLPGDNVVVLRTDRYATTPLTLSGPGAGPGVTAANLLTDLLLATRDLSLRRRRRAKKATASAGGVAASASAAA